MEIRTPPENPVVVLRRIYAEQAILAQTRWAPLHDYAHYGDVADKFDILPCLKASLRSPLRFASGMGFL